MNAREQRDTILEVRRMMPSQEQDSPFELPSEQISPEEPAPQNKPTAMLESSNSQQIKDHEDQ